MENNCINTYKIFRGWFFKTKWCVIQITLDERSLHNKKSYMFFLYNPLDKINISNGRIYNTREWPML